MSSRVSSIRGMFKNIKNKVVLSLPCKRAIFQIPTFSILSREGIPFTLSLYMECEIPIHLYFLRSKGKLNELKENLKARILEECANKSAISLDDQKGIRIGISKLLSETTKLYSMSFLDITDFSSERHIDNEFNKLLESKEKLNIKSMEYEQILEKISKENHMKIESYKSNLEFALEKESVEEEIIKNLLKNSKDISTKDVEFLLMNQLIQHFKETSSNQDLNNKYSQKNEDMNSSVYTEEDYRELIKKVNFYDNELLYSTEELEEEIKKK